MTEVGGRTGGAYHLDKPPGWNLVHKSKATKFDEMGERTATTYI